MSKNQLNEIEDFIDKNLVQVDEEKIFQTDIRSKYYEMLENLIDFNSIKESGINLIVDSMGGCGQQILENLLIINDIRSKTIFKFSENNFSGRVPEPIKENLQPVIDEIKKSEDFSFAVATDGDADRVTVISDDGDILNDNQIALLLTDYILNNKNESGEVIKSIIHTEMLENIAVKNKVKEIPVGLRFFSDHILHENFLAGFEGNGSFILGKGIPNRDGILTSLVLAEMLAKSGYKKLSDYIHSKKELLNDIYSDAITLNDFKPDKINFLSENIPSGIGNFKIKSYNAFRESNNDLNSVKLNFEGGRRWVTIRKSDYYPLLRINAEGNTEKEVQQILNETSILLRD